MKQSLTVVGVILIAGLVGYGVMQILFPENNPKVLAFDVQEEEVNDLETFYTIDEETNCSENFVNETPEVNIGTMTGNSDLVLLKTYPGETLRFCSPNGTTSELFTIIRDSGTYDTKPDRIDVGNGYVNLTYSEFTPEEFENGTR